MPAEPQPTPEDVELGADALARARGYADIADVEKVSPGTASWFREDTGTVLAALASAGRLRDGPEAPNAAECPVCGGRFQLKKDGTLRMHRGNKYQGLWRQNCDGVGQPPGPWRPVEDTQPAPKENTNG